MSSRMVRWAVGPIATPTPLPSPLTRAAARRKAGLSLRKAAELLETDAPTLSRWERGRTPRPPKDAAYARWIAEWIGDEGYR